ncbi:tetratricopeptide repeat protein [Actinoplanes sp. NEAU-A12]|uniref:Tetratricopeptide repeat protein n=1 Tax=Actinoplanes sandaracinus TaxID=3045177 RepID=A0ABT6WNW9_9ACTN|nr:tetratricopeptide repeat protein [Actinoplanes sandaracinus]MDI6101401.1 tetratricopeptide repeat protein [Actinoplanes sandaracinus]
MISTIEGMAGVGKTRLAVHAGYLLHQRQPFERVFFVDLRGFDPDPAQPPADPAAVLDGFLRLLGMPGHQIPHDLDARRRLADLLAATHLCVDAFTPDEARAFLAGAVPGIPVGSDPRATARIARRCRYLPLALGLVAGHIRGTPGWTLTDHADRLDERHHDRRLDTGVELAPALSHQRLPADRRRLLRLLALHPGQDFDAYAAAAMADADLDTTRAGLVLLRDDHLLQEATPGRFTFHDLTRAYAAIRAADEEPPPARRAALTRLFDHYLATAAAAMHTLHPAESLLRPQILPPGTPAPGLTGPDSAREWLDTARPTLVAVAVHAATRGRPAHTTLLSRILQRYLAAGGHNTDAVTVHDHGYRAARQNGDPVGQAHALIDIGFTYGRLGRYGSAAESMQRAVDLFRHTGRGRARDDFGDVGEPPGRNETAVDRSARALTRSRQVDDRVGEAYALEGLGLVHLELGWHESAADHLRRALTPSTPISAGPRPTTSGRTSPLWTPPCPTRER